MVVRDEIPGNENHNINQWFDKMARAPMLCLRVFSFGFTLLAAPPFSMLGRLWRNTSVLDRSAFILGAAIGIMEVAIIIATPITTFIIILTVILLIDTASPS